jgi:hypothetical protein
MFIKSLLYTGVCRIRTRIKSESALCCRQWQGKQSHEDHFAGNRNFIMQADSREINSQSPEPWSVSGDGLYTPQVGNVTREFFSVWFTGGQKDKSVTEKGVGYRVSPNPHYKMWSQLQQTLQSWLEVCNFAELPEKAACRLRVGKPKNSHVGSNIVPAVMAELFTDYATLLKCRFKFCM